jgi:hypothetical protein
MTYPSIPAKRASVEREASNAELRNCNHRESVHEETLSSMVFLVRNMKLA